MKKTKTKITVDKNIIMAANKLVKKDGTTCSCHCPVSLALNQQTDFHGWFVSHYYKEAMTLGGNRFKLPKVASVFLEKWEQNRNYSVPFSFDMPHDQSTIEV